MVCSPFIHTPCSFLLFPTYSFHFVVYLALLFTSLFTLCLLHFPCMSPFSPSIFCCSQSSLHSTPFHSSGADRPRNFHTSLCGIHACWCIATCLFMIQYTKSLSTEGVHSMMGTSFICIFKCLPTPKCDVKI